MISCSKLRMNIFISFFLFFAVRAARISRCSLRSPRWENLDLLEDENFPYTTKLLSSGKKVLLTDSIVSFHDAMRVCQAVCGRIFLPKSKEENQEATEFIKNNGAEFVWLRTSDKYQEGVWTDLETLANLPVTFWGEDQPKQKEQDYAILARNGWWAGWTGNADYIMILCELPPKITIHKN